MHICRAKQKRARERRKSPVSESKNVDSARLASVMSWSYGTRFPPQESDDICFRATRETLSMTHCLKSIRNDHGSLQWLAVELNEAMQPMIIAAYLFCLKLDRCPSSMVSSQNRTSASVATERFTQLSGLARFFLSSAHRSSPQLVHRPAVLMHGIYVVSMEIGNGYEDSFLRPLDSQVEEFCTKIRADPRLDRGFNMLGFSQGSLIVRGAVERCSLPVHNLITLNGLHQGVFGIPYLLKLPTQFRHQITHHAYDSPVQNRFSLANTWRDPIAAGHICLSLPFLTRC